MLFHLTMTHTVDNCPGYNHEKLPELAKAMQGMKAKAKELNIKPLFIVNGAPEHVSYALFEADDPFSIAMFVTEVPIKQDFKVTPVEHQEDVMKRAMESMAGG